MSFFSLSQDVAVAQYVNSGCPWMWALENPSSLISENRTNQWCRSKGRNVYRVHLNCKTADGNENRQGCCCCFFSWSLEWEFSCQSWRESSLHPILNIQQWNRFLCWMAVCVCVKECVRVCRESLLRSTPKKAKQISRSRRRLQSVSTGKQNKPSDWSSQLKSEAKYLCKRGGASTRLTGRKLFCLRFSTKQKSV